MKTRALLAAAALVVLPLAGGCRDTTGDQIVGFHEFTFTVHNDYRHDLWIYAVDDDGQEILMRPVDRGDSFDFVESRHWVGKLLVARCDCDRGVVVATAWADDDLEWTIDPWGGSVIEYRDEDEDDE